METTTMQQLAIDRIKSECCPVDGEIPMKPRFFYHLTDQDWGNSIVLHPRDYGKKRQRNLAKKHKEKINQYFEKNQKTKDMKDFFRY